MATSYGGSGRALSPLGHAVRTDLSEDRTHRAKSDRPVRSRPERTYKPQSLITPGLWHLPWLSNRPFGIEVATVWCEKPMMVFGQVWRPLNSTAEAKMSGVPRGDVFSEMKGCLDQGISGRPSLARFVEITYEAILQLKHQLDELHHKRSRARAKRRHRSQEKNRDGKPSKS